MPHQTNPDRDPIVQETQCLVSQILHDFISYFTAISTGLDMPLHMAKDIFPILIQSRQQINAYLNVMRYVFAQGEGSDQQGEQMMAAYGKTLGILITGRAKSFCKIMTGLILWATKQVHGRSETTIAYQENTLHVRSSSLKAHSYEMDVLLNLAPCKSPRDSFSAYLARLLQQQELSLTAEYPTQGELILRLQKKEFHPTPITNTYTAL